METLDPPPRRRGVCPSLPKSVGTTASPPVNAPVKLALPTLCGTKVPFPVDLMFPCGTLWRKECTGLSFPECW